MKTNIAAVTPEINNIALPVISDYEIEKLCDKFFDWCKEEFDEATLQQVEGISYKTVGRALSKEKKDLNWKTVKSLADYKGVSLDSIFGLDERPLEQQVILERYNLAMILTLNEKSFGSLVSKIKDECKGIIQRDSLNCPSSLTIPGFARRVTSTRLEKKITLQQLAKSIKVRDLSLVTYNKLNSRGIRLKRLLSLALSLGVSLDWLLNTDTKYIPDRIMANYMLIADLPEDSFEKYKAHIFKICNENTPIKIL